MSPVRGFGKREDHFHPRGQKIFKITTKCRVWFPQKITLLNKMGHHGPEVTYWFKLNFVHRLYLPNSEVWRDLGTLSESCTLSVMIWFKLYNNTYTGRQSSSDCRPWNTSLSDPSSRMWTEWSWSTFWLWRTPRSRGVGVVPRSRGVGVVSYSGVSSAKKIKSGVHWIFSLDNTKAGRVPLLRFGHDALFL